MRAFPWSAMFLLVGASSVVAALIPYYRMDSFILLSDNVIYCEELDIQYREIQHPNWTEKRYDWDKSSHRYKYQEIQHPSWTEDRTLVKCKVIKTFKGEFIEGTVVDIDYQSVFRRHLVGEGEKYQMDSTGKTVLKSPAKYIPAGRALVFLRKRKENFTDSYQPVTAKLVQSNKVLQFGQFQGNPGPLVLAEQKPENISLTVGQSYGEIEFLEDVEIALEKSRVLEKPVQINTRDAFK